MIKKHKIIITIFAVFMISIITIAYVNCTFKPRPILAERDDLIIGFIAKEINGKRELIKDYNTDEILEFLQSCTEKRTLKYTTGYCLDDVDLELFIHGSDYSKYIILGNINYTYDPSRDTKKYEIIQADFVKGKLMEILGAESTSNVGPS